jgi:hypothetical protein
MTNEQLHCTGRITPPAMWPEDVVADVDLAGSQPPTVGIEVDPSHDLAGDLDARGRPRIVAPGPKPSLPFLVAARDQARRVVFLRRSDRDDTVGQGFQQPVQNA